VNVANREILDKLQLLRPKVADPTPEHENYEDDDEDDHKPPPTLEEDDQIKFDNYVSAKVKFNEGKISFLWL
jgi:hypothetical protein